ncbi:MAG: hypothetical protein CL840_21295 [Crocinitomicaceae bacterium]|mgnify:FL=1|nr:hypothetical protein [Crocinitomicaceae bacterium]|tara:strand:- start:21729 stop:22442 length:714 start_codon:yes stop_codon:yes gene_type:complete
MATTNTYKHYPLLGNLFKYPEEGYKEEVNKAWEFLRNHYPHAAKELDPFIELVHRKELFEIEEIFSKTFHIQAICFLDLGYVLFGEDYKRGAFLVQMKNEQRKVNHDCGDELPDNLPHVLALMHNTDDDELRNEMAVLVLIPAVKKMLEEFEASRIEIRKRILKRKHKVLISEHIEGGNIYQNALKAILHVLEKDFAGISYAVEYAAPSSDSFINNCNTCDLGQKTIDSPDSQKRKS